MVDLPRVSFKDVVTLVHMAQVRKSYSAFEVQYGHAGPVDSTGTIYLIRETDRELTYSSAKRRSLLYLQ